MHGLGTGTDRGTWWLWTISLSCAAAVVAAVVWRLSERFARFPQRAERRVAPRLRQMEEVR